jgi:hypothetical protein
MYFGTSYGCRLSHNVEGPQAEGTPEHRRRVLQNTLLRKIFGSEEDSITSSFIICTPHQILFWSIQHFGQEIRGKETIRKTWA